MLLPLVQGIVGVEENESPSADHYPAHGETDSKKNDFTGCKYKFMCTRDAAWGECLTSGTIDHFVLDERGAMDLLTLKHSP